MVVYEVAFKPLVPQAKLALEKIEKIGEIANAAIPLVKKELTKEKVTSKSSINSEKVN